MSARGAPSARRGRGRGGRGSRGGGRQPSGTKRLPANDSDFEDSTPAPKKVKAAVEPRELPARDGRGVNPIRVDAAELHATRAKRPNGTVAAERAEKAQKLADLERQKQEAMALLASINAEQDAALAAAKEDAVDHLDDMSDLTASDADMDCSRQDQPVMAITEEDFDRIEAHDAYNPEAEAAMLAPPKITSSKSKKPVKGSTRAQIEELTKKTKADAAVKVLQNKDAAAASKNAGLSKIWKGTKHAIPDNDSSAAAPSTAADNLSIGGLTDEHASATRPSEESKKGPRENTLVALVSSDTEDTPIRKPEATFKPPRKPRGRPRVQEPEKIPALDLKTQPSLKIESSASSLTVATVSSPSPDDKALPALVARNWSSMFLPAMYRALMLHPDPMAIGLTGTDPVEPGKDTVAFLQAILDEKYRNNTLVIKWGDSLCTKAVSRLQDHKGAIAKYGLNVVTNIFKKNDYYKNPEGTAGPTLRRSQAIAKDAKDALRSDGKAFYKTPTPKEVSTLGSDNPGYIKPKGFLESEPIIQTLAWFIRGDDFRVVVTKTDQGDIDDFTGLPMGGLAMAAAAIERGYNTFTTGEFVKPLDFSAMNYGNAVAGFMVSIKQFRRSRWESILKNAGRQIIEVETAKPPEDLEPVSLDGKRETMYIPSSP